MERRSTDRIAMNVKASARVPATPHRVTVLDMSHSGCRVSFDHANIPSGSTVHLDLKPASSVTGQVVWVNAGAAGIQFHRRLRSDLAVDMGIEEPPAPKAPKPVDEATPIAEVLSHWVRRAFGLRVR